MTDIVDTLLAESDVVRKECFPGGDITVGDAIAFMLGIPLDSTDEVLEVMDRVARSRLDEDDEDVEETLKTMMFIMGVEMGVAAQRINSVSVP